MAKKTTGSAKRYGARYGRRLREKVSAVEKEYLGKKKCPYCHNMQLKRQAAGIWLCYKCEAKFTARAYTPVLSKVKTVEE